MQLASDIAKATMSFEELVACEDVLDGNREDALALLSDMESIRAWHKAENCLDEGQACPLCELCSTDGLLGATKKVLETYEDADSHLKRVRASLGNKASGRGESTERPWSPPLTNFSKGLGRETLFTSQLAKTVLFCIITVGENLRSQHATWALRLQSVVASLSLSTPSSRRGSTGLAKNSKENIPLPTCVRPTNSGSKATPTFSDMISEFASNSSTFLVFRRCLSSDCPCEANKANAGFDAHTKDTCGSQVTPEAPPSSSGSKKTRKSKAARSTATNPQDGPKKTSGAALAQTSTDTRTGQDVRAFDMPTLQHTAPREYEPSAPASDGVASTQETETFPPSPECEALIVDPRVFRLRAELVRSDVARRALMDWCRTGLQLGPRESELTSESRTRGTHRYEKIENPRSRWMGGDNIVKGGLDGEETTASDMQVDFEQEELKKQWLMSRQRQSKDRKRRSTAVRKA